ncbi:hypothetical protein I307_01260 [Cryptococcus deuterogattii 99/473]|uniref:GST C-terminal domain-containing protein n=1 Tax=Cryptococcus deuterogattii Ram5 TaxID=1296110 RepID=A0A0D0TU34_9TREE|nr:hypothetical protein I309_01419 [Cryptococcus deuterogattii LA55]KIR39383.1 hypothetical protein I313_04404 [Cryptococcus deuterogattii Ram5]KIR73717.1 hypothetical protein I310_02390 [Cryptococcus deuterogattii CA1014]KIR93209.1 hypothetical protein I304_02873 [Cryptococcus deuterogattii CBS 10090]KIY59013.1 hypothetical protein I307_01260 [Cryptococcus deuterogattii 99/473]
MTAEQQEFPKAVLYSWPSSVWSTVPRLCLYEKGYSEDEYIVKYVDITKGENFSPSYLKYGPDFDRSYFRDYWRGCEHQISFIERYRYKPAPTLAPATIDGKALSDSVIELVHHPAVDPNFLSLSAVDSEDLERKSRSGPGKSLVDRRKALQNYLAEARKAASETSVSPKNGSLILEQKIVQFLEEKLKSSEEVWQLYHGQSGEEKLKQFFDISIKTWTERLPEACAKLEEMIEEPYFLGDQISLADLHVISWLARLVSIADGSLTKDGLNALEAKMGKPPGDKLRNFWKLWAERESFQKVLVPASSAFQEMK